VVIVVTTNVISTSLRTWIFSKRGFCNVPVAGERVVFDIVQLVVAEV
jgi:hypothetical protein